MSMGGRKLLTIFYLRQKTIVEKKLIDRPRHASLLTARSDSPGPAADFG
jgi:hypothetical protein